MSMTTQFSLSTELTNLVPAGQIISAATNSFIELARKLQKSGSDPVVEADFVKLLGQNRIEARFASSFRTAVSANVQPSPISKILDIVLTPSGPTVARCLTSGNERYFSMVVQLSLLTFSHRLAGLAEALDMMFRRLFESNTEDSDTPDRSAISGLLNACKEQTSDFRWNRMFEAVETCVPGHDFSLGFDSDRALPLSVIEGLLRCFQVLQKFPEENYLKIKTSHGVSTIVVWAHKVLGLDVQVMVGKEPVHFGKKGSEQVLVEYCRQSRTSFTMYQSDGTDHHPITLQLPVSESEDLYLDAEYRRSAKGYGTYLLKASLAHELHKRRHEIALSNTMTRELSLRIYAVCLLIAQKGRDASENCAMHNDRSVPSNDIILETAAFLFEPFTFEEHEIETALKELMKYESIDAMINSVPRSVSYFNSSVATHNGEDVTSLDFHKFVRILFTFATIESIQDCENLQIAPRNEEWFQGDLFSISTNFKRLACLMSHAIGDPDVDMKFDLIVPENAAAISQNGWTLLVGSLAGAGPDRPSGGVLLRRGVPSYRGHCRRLILDDASSGDYFIKERGISAPVGADQMRLSPDSPWILCRATAMPAERLNMSTRYSGEQSPNFVSVQRTSFVVFSHFVCTLPDNSGPYTCRMGYRRLQECHWNSYLLHPCVHPHDADDKIMETQLPRYAIAFQGFGSFYRDIPRLRETQGSEDLDWRKLVHLSLVSDTASRWMTLHYIQACCHNRAAKLDKSGVHGDPNPWESAAYIRPRGCCLLCAIEQTYGHDTDKVKFLIA